MRKILFFLLLLFSGTTLAQNNIYTSGGISQTVGPPTYTPGRLGNVVAIDTATGYWYVTPNRLSGTAWLGFGFPLANISGSVPPAFTPTKFQPRFVINAVDSMYYYNGTAWKHVNKQTAAGITSLNGLTAGAQTFATGTTGTNFNISSSTSTHTFNLPTASATNRGALSSADWSTFNGKVGGSGTSGQVAYWGGSSAQTGSPNFLWDDSNVRLNIGAPSAPTARVNIRGGGTTSGTLTQIWTNSGNTELMRVRDDGNVGIGTTTLNGRLNLTDNGSYGIYQSGAAPNYFLGSIGIGQTNLTGHNLYIRKDLGGSATVYGIRSQATLLSSVTSSANGVYCLFNTDPASFTVPNVFYFRAQQGTIDVGSSITNQFAYHVDNTMIGAANNYGYFSGINAGSGRWNFYANGSARNYFAGNTAIGTINQDASSAFEVSSTTQGVLFPRMTTTQRDAIATPANGLVIYNSTTDKLQVRAGGAWVDLH